MKTIDYSIILTGMTSSGKTTLANEVVKCTSFKKASFGGYLFNYAKKNNIGTKKEDLQMIGQNFININPERFLSDVLEFSVPGTNVCFEGIRHSVIMNQIKKISDRTISFYIEAPAQVRFKRFNEREANKINWKEFNQLDKHVVESEIKFLKQQCDIVLDGNKDVETLIGEVIKVI